MYDLMISDFRLQIAFILVRAIVLVLVRSIIPSFRHSTRADHDVIMSQ